MSESFTLTFDDTAFVKARGPTSIPERKRAYSPRIKRVSIPQGKQALYCLQADAFKPKQSDQPQFIKHWHLFHNHDDTEVLTGIIKYIRNTPLVAASTVSVTRLQGNVDIDVSTLEVKRTKAAEAFITRHNLESAAKAAEDALKKTFEDIRQVRLDFDPGDEEEEDHPWIRVYVQTGMDAASTLKARKRFYKALNSALLKEQLPYFHLAFRIVS